MQVKEKSFFQTTAGVVTGVAGILTAVVGLLTVGAQMGWLGSKNGGTPASTSGSTTPGAPPTSAGSLGTPTTAGRTATTAAGSESNAPQFTVDPPAVTFENLGPRDQDITITNTGSSSISFFSPTVTGSNAARFAASDETCGSGLDAGRTCQLKVTFTPSGAGTFTGTLVIKPTVGPNREVPLKGTALL
jgi:hypothetical protein